MKQTEAFTAGCERDQFLADVVEGLSASEKSLPCKYFYDRRGSQLFDAICRLEEYYPTRAELDIMQRHGAAIARCMARPVALVEYGSGSSRKTRLLLDRLGEGTVYIPVEISLEHLRETVRQLAARYPDIEIRPLCADFSQPFRLPAIPSSCEQTVVYFPGSTIGNFDEDEAVELLSRMAGQAGSGGGLLIGVDLKKSRPVLEAAYNDAKGVTSEFNLNLLRRINRELDGDFALEEFRHHAFYNVKAGRVEMHLVSRADQTVTIDGMEFDFRRGETIHTESSYKYSLADFQQIAAAAGWQVAETWQDPAGLFSVQYLEQPPNS